MQHMKTAVAVFLILVLVTLCACKNKKPAEDPDVTESAADTVSESAVSSTLANQSNTVSATQATSETASTAAATSATAATSTTAPSTTAAPTTATSATAAPSTTAQPTSAASDFSSFDKNQTLNFLSAAINKTKAYTGNITVHHKESFTSTVTNVTPGGALATRGVNFVKDLVLKPGEEDYVFSGGTATTSEGETTQLLLPKAAPFTLSPEGVAQASISQEGDLVHVKITLAPEQVDSLTAVPKYNASAIGYLDIANAFKIIKVTEVHIKYPGSVIDAYVRGDGYVSSVTYTITLDASSKASAMGISGGADFYGDQVEVWDIKW